MAESSEITVTLGRGKRVDAHVGAHLVRTDQPRGAGGEDTAPSPYSLFLASLATCAGFFVQRFCASREIPTDGIGVVLRTEKDPQTGAMTKVLIDVRLPPSFPEKYRDAVLRAVDGCSVKKAIQAQPAFEVKAV
jgi:ribosomal protein S12 methylthiotransferase accessory factor